MYRNFFSLSDLPFSIAPDPKYIFMSERHKEALSHLTYGQGEVGGFALLTGEVGTGKTTVSRCLMEQLPENTQAAFILNPMLSSQELLATLCDELSLEYNTEDISLKNLTDKIAEKLLANHEKGVNTLLIIDEAQHLQPEVLEQLRLLTNLETNTKKLLQVILIGQPELQQLLQRRDLRQLAQRITARYHLMPLTKAEVKQYIQHRLSIADCARNIFDKGAIHKVHQLSEGIPRLVNLLCHSSLMLAYNQNNSVVDKKIVMAAAENVLGASAKPTAGSYGNNKWLLLATTVSIVGFIGIASFWWGQTSQQSNTADVYQTPEGQVEENVMTEPTLPEKSKAQLLASESITQGYQPDTVSAEREVTQEHLAQNSLPNHAATDEVSDSPINYAMHTVAYGESLYTISLKYNTKIQALLRWNNIGAESDVSIGDRLHVIAPIGSESKQLVIHANDNTITSERDSSFEAEPKNTPTFNEDKIDGVSEDLLALFQSAVNETEAETPDLEKLSIDTPVTETDTVKGINQLTVVQQNALPSMQFEQHIYASDGEGWVTVNGRDRYEGDYISSDLRVDKILPQSVILSFKGDKFSMPALTNW